MDIKDKVIIITGASSGIAQATAMKSSKEGAKVVLSARRKDKLVELKKTIENKSGEALVVIADVTKKADMEKLVAKTLEEYGTINAIINMVFALPPLNPEL